MNRNDLEIRKIHGLLGGQSLSVVLPKAFVQNLGIQQGDFVKVYPENNRIVIEKV